MAIAVIDEDGDLTVEVIEYENQVEDGNGNRPVARTLQFRVRREVLTKHSSTFAAMFRPSHWREALSDFVKLEEDSVASMDIWFRILHDTGLVYDVPLEEMWHLVTACDKYHFDLRSRLSFLTHHSPSHHVLNVSSGSETTPRRVRLIAKLFSAETLVRDMVSEAQHQSVLRQLGYTRQAQY